MQLYFKKKIQNALNTVWCGIMKFLMTWYDKLTPSSWGEVCRFQRQQRGHARMVPALPKKIYDLRRDVVIQIFR